MLFPPQKIALVTATLKDRIRADLPLDLADLAQVGGQIFESGTTDFSLWFDQMTDRLGLTVSPYLQSSWQLLPTAATEDWSQMSSALLSQQERVALLFACRDFISKWNEAEDRRKTPAVQAVGDLIPSQREEYLMRLLGFQSLRELEEFLSGPSDPAFLQESEVPDEDYELAEREEDEEEQEYMAQAEIAKYRKKQIVQSAPKKNAWRQPLFVMSGISTLLVLCGIAKLPYGYYMLLRLFLCIEAVYGFSLAWDRSKNFWRWFYGIAAVVYNPFFPLRLREKSLWIALNFVTILFYWIATTKLCASDKAA